jgi:hypothetical protein
LIIRQIVVIDLFFGLGGLNGFDGLDGLGDLSCGSSVTFFTGDSTFFDGILITFDRLANCCHRPKFKSRFGFL